MGTAKKGETERRMALVADKVRYRLAQHGIAVDEDKARDVAAHVLIALAQDERKERKQ